MSARRGRGILAGWTVDPPTEARAMEEAIRSRTVPGRIDRVRTPAYLP